MFHKQFVKKLDKTFYGLFQFLKLEITNLEKKIKQPIKKKHNIKVSHFVINHSLSQVKYCF